MQNCRWWNRWYHRRLRRIDEKYILDAIVRASVRYDGSNERRRVFVRLAWGEFKNEPGQEHWHCECAKQEEKVSN